LSILIKLKNLFLKFGRFIQNIINFLLLFVVYFVGIGLTSLISKLVHKTFLFLNGNKNSYWDENKVIAEDKETSGRMF